MYAVSDKRIQWPLSHFFQIHLHDPGENPVMSDQGFSLAPGSYTKVAVKRVEVRVLVAQ